MYVLSVPGVCRAMCTYVKSVQDVIKLTIDESLDSLLFVVPNDLIEILLLFLPVHDARIKKFMNLHLEMKTQSYVLVGNVPFVQYPMTLSKHNGKNLMHTTQSFTYCKKFYGVPSTTDMYSESVMHEIIVNVAFNVIHGTASYLISEYPMDAVACLAMINENSKLFVDHERGESYFVLTYNIAFCCVS